MFPWWAALLVSLGVLCIVLVLLGLLCIRHSASRDAFSKLINEDSILPVVGLRNRNVFVFLGEGETAEKIKLFGRGGGGEEGSDGGGQANNPNPSSSKSGGVGGVGGRRMSNSSGDSMIFISPKKSSASASASSAVQIDDTHITKNTNSVPSHRDSGHHHTLVSVTSGGLDAIPADLYITKALNHIRFSERKARVFRADSNSFLGGGGGGGGVDMHSSMLDGACIIEEKREGGHQTSSSPHPPPPREADHVSTASSTTPATRQAAAQSVTSDPRESGVGGVRSVLSSSDLTPASSPVERTTSSSHGASKRSFAGRAPSTNDGGEGAIPTGTTGRTVSSTAPTSGHPSPPTREDGEDASNAKRNSISEDDDKGQDDAASFQDGDEDGEGVGAGDSKRLRAESSHDPIDDLL